MSEYDISRAFKRIENDLMDSMMRNLKRHQAEETDLGIEWEQWQALQLKELERYRKQNADKFTDDFDQINRKVDAMFRATCNDAQSKQENYLLEQIKKGDFTPTQTKDTQFFNLNDAKLNILIERTKADFTRAEYAMLRKADDAYRKVIFDAQVYANVTNDYAKAVDMATHDFLMKGIQCVQYSNGAKHTLENYAEMCVRTGNKRAYLMGEGNAHDKYGIHTVRVNKRTQACPKCVKFLGRVLIDDVYSGGTAKEASDLGVPTLSSAIQAGFLHPNCKDIYSLYIPNVSKPATPWTQSEINDIVGDYNTEQDLQHAIDMAESYRRMSKYALSPENQARYQARADNWQERVDILQGNKPTPIIPPVAPPAPQPVAPTVEPFTDAEKEALEYYVSGDGMYLNNYLRGIGDIQLDDEEKRLLNNLKTATNRPLEGIDKLYRSVDAKVIFSDLSEEDIYNMMQHLRYGDSVYDKGAYSQGIKKRMETALNKAKGKELTEKGFMSTTVDNQVAVNWGDFTGAENPVVIELDTKSKKLKGADLDFLDIAEDPQRERLLAPNVKYKVTDIGIATDADGMKYVRVKAEFIEQAEEAIVETTEAIEKPKFVPATTIQEAEEYAMRFTDPSRFGALGVSYDGVSVDVANVVNKTVGDFFAEYDVDAFGGIIAPKGNTKLGKLVDGATAGYSPVRHSFLLNRKSLKDVKTAEKALRKELDAVTNVLNNPDKYDLSKMSARARAVINASAISGRGTVPLTVEEVLWHELGHSLEKKMSRLPNFDIVKANMATYAPQISGYATDSLSEYIAESFCSYKKGEGIIDPELVKAFDAVRRK